MQSESAWVPWRLWGAGTEAVMTIRLDSGTARYELDLCQTHLVS
jgi:hypothetical protein